MKNQYDLFEGVPEARRIVHEYLGVISPPKVIANKVVAQKEKAHSIIGLNDANRYSKPHLTLMNFRRIIGQENFVIEQTCQALAAERAFLVKLRGIDFFEKGRHIVNNVESSFPIKRIFGLLKRAFPSQRIRKFNPHITVARGLSPHDFQTLQPLLPEFNFVAGFICNSITLLRREIEFERGRVVVENYVKIHEVPLR